MIPKHKLLLRVRLALFVLFGIVWFNAAALAQTATIVIGPNDPGAQSVAPGDLNIVTMQVCVTMAGGNDTITDMEFDENGSLDALVDVSAAKLFLDVDNSGTVNTGDTFLASGAFDGANGKVKFKLSQAINSGQTLYFLLVIDLAGSAVNGDTFIPRLRANKTKFANAPKGPNARITGSTLTMDTSISTLIIAVGGSNPGASNEANNSTNLPMTQISFSTNSTQAATITALTFRHGQTGAGTIVENIDATNAKLYADNDNDGAVTPVIDTQIGGAFTFTADDQVITFSGFSATIPVNSTKHWLLVYNLGGSASNGETFDADALLATNNGDITITTGGMVVTYADIVGGNKTISSVGVLTATLGGNTPPASTESASAITVPMVQVALTANQAENISVSSIKFTASGAPGNDQTDISAVKLYRDVNGDGQLDTATEPQIGTTQTYAADNGTVTFSGLSETILLGTTQNWLLVYDFAGTAAINDQFIASINAAADITATGVSSSQSITPSGSFAITGNTKTIGTVGTLTASIGPANPGAHTEIRTAQNIEMIQVKLTANGVEQLELRKLTFWSSGTGHDRNDLNNFGGVVLYVDEDANGLLTAADSVYSTEFYKGDNKEFKKGGKIFINPNETVYMLLVHNYNGAATNGDTFNTRLLTIDVRGVTSGGQANKVGLPLFSNTCILDDGADTSLQVAVGGNNPGASSVPNDDTNLPMLQFSLQAGTAGDAEVTAITFDTVGTTTANEQFDVSAVKLWRDVNGNGIVEAGTDVQIWSTGTFAADNGSITFTGAAQTILAGNAENWLVAYDLNGTASNNETLRLQLANAGAVAARDKSTANAITVTGTLPIQGGLKTVSSTGVLTISTGPANPAPRNIGTSQANLVTVQVNLAANNAESINVTSITFTAAGTGDDRSVLSGGSIATTSVKLYRDVNSNGAFDSGLDIQIGSSGNFSADNGTVTFSSLTEVINAGASKDWILVYDVSAAAAGNTFIVKVANNSDITASGVITALSITPIGAPVAGGTATVSLTEALTITLGPNNPPAQNVSSGATGVVAMQIALTATNAGDIQFWNNSPNGNKAETKFLASGSGNDQNDIQNARLYADINGDGLVDAGDTLLETGFTYNGDNKDLKFKTSGGSGWDGYVIPAGTTVYWLLVYDFNGGATNGETYKASIAKFDSMKRMYGATSGNDINQVQGAPVSSNLITISNTGSLSIAAGTQNAQTPNGPGDETVIEGAVDVEVLQFKLAAGSIEAIDISQVIVNFSGTGNDLNDITSVSLYNDNGATPGTLDGTDTAIKTGQTVSADNGIVTFSGLTEQIVANSTETWLVVLTFNTNAVNGQSFRAAITANTNITAVGNTSTNSIIPAGAPVNGGFKTIEATGTLTLAAGDQNPGATNEPSAAPDVEIVQIKLTAGPNEAVKVTQVVVDALVQTTDGDDSTDITDVSLYNDVNNNGIFDIATDTAIATGGTYAANNGTVTFAALTEVIAANGTEQWLVVYDFNAGATNGEQYQAQIATTNITAAGNATANAITVGGVTALGGVKTITTEGTLTLTLGASTPPPSNEASGTSGVELLQVTLTADAVENISITSIKFTDAGTNSGNLATELSGARLYNDTNGNGILDGDPQIGGLGTLSGTGITFPGLTEVIDLGTSENWLLVLDFSTGAISPDTFISTVNAAGNVDVSGSTPNAVAGTFAVTGNTITISATPTLTVGLGTETPLAGNVTNDEQVVETLQLLMSASSAGDVTVTAITITASGTADDLTDITGASIDLYEDNGTTLGVIDGSDTLIKAGGTFSANDGTVTFTGLTKTITANTAQKWLLVYNLAGFASGGETFATRVNGLGDVTIVSGTVTGTFPVQGNTKTVSDVGTLGLALGDSNPSAADIANNAQDVEMIQVKLTASAAENINVTAITFTASGTIDDRNNGAGGDLLDAGVTLYRDANNNGILDGDPTISSAGNYSVDNGTIAFSGLTEVINASTTENWLLVIDLDSVTPSASNGETLIASLNAAANVTATGATSTQAITPTGTYPLTGSTMTVSNVGQLTIVAGTNSPGNATISNAATNLEMVQLALSANGTENIDITAITFSALGTADDRNAGAGGDIADAGVSLYLDVNDNGVYDSGTDTQIGSSGNYSANNGTIAFTGLSETINAGSSESWLLVYNLGATASAGETFIARILNNSDITAVGTTSTQSITPAGAPVTGGTQTITANAVLSVSAGANNPVNTSEFNNASDLAMIQVQLTASNSGSNIDITTITINASGSAHDVTDLTGGQVRLYNDNGTAAGTLDGSDTLIQGSGTFSADNGTVSFGSLTETITNNTTENWIVVIDLAGSASDGETFISKLQDPTTDITATESGSAPGLTISGGIVTGGTKTITSVSAVVWDGSDSIFWNVPGNWDQNVVPGNSITVTIPNTSAINSPTVDIVGAEAKTLTIQASGDLTINSGKSLALTEPSGANTVTGGALTVNGTLKIASAASLTVDAASSFAAGAGSTITTSGGGNWTLSLSGDVNFAGSSGLPVTTNFGSITLASAAGKTVAASYVKMNDVATGGTYLTVSGTAWNLYRFDGFGFEDIVAAGEVSVAISSGTDILMKNFDSGGGFISGDASDNEIAGRVIWNATAIRLTAMNAKPVKAGVLVTWATAMEINNAGFAIYRLRLNGKAKVPRKFPIHGRDAKWKRLNPELILGAVGSMQPQYYRYTDATAKPEVRYAYVIVDHDLGNNESAELAPIAVIVPQLKKKLLAP